MRPQLSHKHFIVGPVLTPRSRNGSGLQVRADRDFTRVFVKRVFCYKRLGGGNRVRESSSPKRITRQQQTDVADKSANTSLECSVPVSASRLSHRSRSKLLEDNLQTSASRIVKAIAAFDFAISVLGFPKINRGSRIDRVAFRAVND
jgi:hypothetical protein